MKDFLDTIKALTIMADYNAEYGCDLIGHAVDAMRAGTFDQFNLDDYDDPTQLRSHAIGGHKYPAEIVADFLLETVDCEAAR